MTKTTKYILIGVAVVAVLWFVSRQSSGATSAAKVGSPSASGSAGGVLGDLKQAATGGVNALFDWLK